MSNSPMFFVFFVVVVLFTAVCGTEGTECGDVLKPCLERQLHEQFTPGANPCTIASNFVGCVSLAVSRAERAGTCDVLAELHYRHNYLLYATSHQLECPDLVVPAYLNVTNPCDVSLAECGSPAVVARFLQSTGDLVNTCVKLDEFTLCMNSISPNNCSNQTAIRDLLDKEMLDRDFNTTCVGTTTSTTTTPSPTTTSTTTTASTTTSTTTKTTTRSSDTNDGASPKTTIIATTPTTTSTTTKDSTAHTTLAVASTTRHFPKTTVALTSRTTSVMTSQRVTPRPVLIVLTHSGAGPENGFHPLRTEYHLLVAAVLLLCFWLL